LPAQGRWSTRLLTRTVRDHLRHGRAQQQRQRLLQRRLVTLAGRRYRRGVLSALIE